MKIHRLLTVVVPLALALPSAGAKASDWGCEVLLCLANPGSPTEFAECVSPITRLWNALRKVHPDPFPTCDMADGNDGSSYAKLVNNAFDPCPEGLSPSNGGVVVEGTRNPNGTFNITQPETVSAAYGSMFAMNNLACVGNLVGSYDVWDGGINQDGQSTGYGVGIYDKVEWQAPQSSSAVDVYIDNKMYKRVHY